MQNRQEQLEKRGYLEGGMESEFGNISFEKRIELLESEIATERTLGARLLKENKNEITVDYLMKALKIEKKLYPKIEICNTLSELNEIAVNPLIKILGDVTK